MVAGPTDISAPFILKGSLLEQWEEETQEAIG